MVTFDLCEGNPGALTFMMAAYDKYLFFAERAFARMRDNGVNFPRLKSRASKGAKFPI